jgi:16S rRNA (guanine966-N2)-methyltransferase|tara:strand:- start:613 stop:1149 length:537 start_codon:yes stop_codon:yes gene_type:complete
VRIISGKYKGRKINAPNNLPVRPTTDRAKEALFNILNNRYNIAEKNILDLFSGTGNISYEFASRDAKSIYAVDKNIECTSFIQKINNQLELNINTIFSDVFSFIQKTDLKFDIIFADPPYNSSFYNELKDLILEGNILNNEGCLIIEHDNNTIFNDKNLETRKYGNVYFSIFQIKNNL